MDAVRQHHRQCFRPDEAILGIAGRVEPQRMFDLVEEAFGGWKSQPAPELQKGDRGARRDHIQHDSTQTQIGIAYDSVPYRDPEYYAAWAAVSVLSGGSSSRLFTEVRERRGLCYSVYAMLHSLKHEGRVLCYAGTNAERAQQTLDVTLGELQRIVQGIEPAELDRCKARAKSSLVMQQESSSARASSVAHDWYHLARVKTLAEVRAQIDALTVDSVKAHLEAHPPPRFHRIDARPAAAGGFRCTFMRPGCPTACRSSPNSAPACTASGWASSSGPARATRRPTSRG
jgi:predicted Zn-dependent peptidase